MSCRAKSRVPKDSEPRCNLNLTAMHPGFSSAHPSITFSIVPRRYGIQESYLSIGPLDCIPSSSEQVIKPKIDFVPPQAQRPDSLSSIRSLPVEILGEIFGLATWSEFYGSPSRNGLIRLTRVCRAWRDAAYATGWLWSSLSITDPRISAEDYQGITTWFNRARGTRKSLRIFRLKRGICPCLTNDGGECECLDPNLLNLLTQQDSFRKLSFQNIYFKCVTTLPDSINRRALDPPNVDVCGNLETCELAVWNQDLDFSTWEDQTEGHRALGRFQNLSTLTLHTPSFWRDTRRLPVPVPPEILSRLIDLTLKCGWKGPQVFQALRHCHNLERLTLVFNNSAPSWTLPGSSIPELLNAGYITLGRVQTLVLDIGSPSPAETLLPLLRFPKLSDLWVKWNSTSTGATPLWTILNGLNAFAIEDPTPIRSLYLGLHGHTPSETVDAIDLIKVLSDIPNLVNLFMYGYGFDAQKLWDNRPRGAAAAALAPTLERWDLRDVRDPFPLGCFLQYIRSRQNYRREGRKIILQEPADKLKRVVLSGDWDSRHTMLRKTYAKSMVLRELRKVFGLTVERIVRMEEEDDI